MDWKKMGVGASIDVKLHNHVLYVLQSGAYPKMQAHNGRLLAVDISAEPPQIVGILENLGNARQLEIQGNVAYITAREDGLFCVDLSVPSNMRVLSHYDTLEYATGIAVSGNLAAISLRQYGIELIHVENPENPMFLSLLRTGEAQSLCMDGRHLYAGVWGTKELVISDIQVPQEPRLLSRAALDGRGDGVAVWQGVCYAATGQHARPAANVRNPAPETYEKLGNGLEIWSVYDPERPVRLGNVKFPPYYGLTFDMWDVQLAGEYALVSNTRNGLYVVNVADPHAPFLVMGTRLPREEDGELEPIAGFDFLGNEIFAAGGDRDAYTLTTEMVFPEKKKSRSTVKSERRQMDFSLKTLEGKSLSYSRILEEYYVRGVDATKEWIFAACSSQGILVLDRKKWSLVDRISTQGFVWTVKAVDEWLFTAEGRVGFCVYRRQGGKWKRQATYSPYGRAVQDFVLGKKQVLLQCASNGVALLDLQRPEIPRVIGECLQHVGLFYGRHFPSYATENFYFGVNIEGILRFDKDNGEKTTPFAGRKFGIGPESGLDWLDGALLYTSEDRAQILFPETGEVQMLEIQGLDHWAGKPRVKDGLLVMTERARGWITLADCTNSQVLHGICRLETSGSPDLACIEGNDVLIPAGHGGLLVLEKPERT